MIRLSCAVAARSSPLPLGALVAFDALGPQPAAPSPCTMAEQACCPACGAVAAFDAAACVFCGEAWNDDDAMLPAPSAIPSSSSSSSSSFSTTTTHVVDYPVPTGVGPREHPISRRASSSAADAARGVGQDTVFVVDRSIAKGDMEALRRMILAALVHLHPSALVGFVVAGAAVSVYELGQFNPAGAYATAEFFSSASPLNPVESELIQTHELTAKSCFLASAAAVRDAMDCVLGALVACSRGDSLKSRRAERLKRLRANRKHRKASKLERRKAPDVTVDNVSPFERPFHTGGAPPARSIYKAAEVASALLRAQHCHGGHIIIFATGPETSAAAIARKDIGRRIADAGIVVSTFLVSSDLVDVPGFDALVPGPPSGIILHSSFADETLPENVLRAIRRVGALNADIASNDYSRAVTLNMSIRCSSGLRLAQVIGAALAVTPATSASPTADDTDDGRLTTLCLSTRGGAIALYFELDEEMQNSSTSRSNDGAEYVQFIMDAISVSTLAADGRGGRYVRRVITKRVRVTKDMPSHLTSINTQITAVMMAKIAVLSGYPPSLCHRERNGTDGPGGGTGSKPAASTDVQLCGMLRRMARWVHTFRGGGASKMAIFPPELQEVARTFYHARCGPLCNAHLHHSDEMALARARFRRARSSRCIRMMMPELWMLPAAELLAASNKSCLDIPSLFKEAPLSSLSLRSDCILVLDAEAQTIVWSGAMMAGVEFDPARAQVRTEWEKITQERFPKPRIIMAMEGSSEARGLLAFVEPSHRDSPFVQLKSVPGLGSLPASELRQLRKKLPHSEGATFSDYIADVFAHVS